MQNHHKPEIEYTDNTWYHRSGFGHTTDIVHYDRSAFQRITINEGESKYGQESFAVNLHGSDGKIVFGNSVIIIDNGLAIPEQESFTTERGIIIELDEIVCNADGVCFINYKYSYDGAVTDNNDNSCDIISISARSSHGYESYGSVECNIYDDRPDISNIMASNGLSGTLNIDFGADGAADMPARISFGSYSINAKGNEDCWTFYIKDCSLPDGTLVFTRIDDHYEYVYEIDNPGKVFNNTNIYLQVYDGDGSASYQKSIRFSNLNPASLTREAGSDDVATLSLYDTEMAKELSEAGYLIAEDSLNELLGSDSSSQSLDWDSQGVNASYLTEQEALVLEQAMRQIENQIS